MSVRILTANISYSMSDYFHLIPDAIHWIRDETRRIITAPCRIVNQVGWPDGATEPFVNLTHGIDRAAHRIANVALSIVDVVHRVVSAVHRATDAAYRMVDETHRTFDAKHGKANSTGIGVNSACFWGNGILEGVNEPHADGFRAPFDPQNEETDVFARASTPG